MAVYWFTGQPSHGKTVLAKLLKEELEKSDRVFHIDGDDLRALTLNIDFSEQGRIDNVKGAQKIAHYLYNQNYTVVVSVIAPYRWQREELKRMLGADLVEIYVHTTEPRERDHFSVFNYEPPLEKFIDIDTTEDTPQESIDKILNLI
jgi:adenylylsulfate kinase-like enzyme